MPVRGRGRSAGHPQLQHILLGNSPRRRTGSILRCRSYYRHFKIDGQPKADADVAPGKSGTAIVKIPASGTVQFYCEYHKGLGMVGSVKPS